MATKSEDPKQYVVKVIDPPGEGNGEGSATYLDIVHWENKEWGVFATPDHVVCPWEEKTDPDTGQIKYKRGIAREEMILHFEGIPCTAKVLLRPEHVKKDIALLLVEREDLQKLINEGLKAPQLDFSSEISGDVVLAGFLPNESKIRTATGPIQQILCTTTQWFPGDKKGEEQTYYRIETAFDRAEGGMSGGAVIYDQRHLPESPVRPRRRQVRGGMSGGAVIYGLQGGEHRLAREGYRKTVFAIIEGRSPGDAPAASSVPEEGSTAHDLSFGIPLTDFTEVRPGLLDPLVNRWRRHLYIRKLLVFCRVALQASLVSVLLASMGWRIIQFSQPNKVGPAQTNASSAAILPDKKKSSSPITPVPTPKPVPDMVPSITRDGKPWKPKLPMDVSWQDLSSVQVTPLPGGEQIYFKIQDPHAKSPMYYYPDASNKGDAQTKASAKVLLLEIGTVPEDIAEDKLSEHPTPGDLQNFHILAR